MLFSITMWSSILICVLCVYVQMKNDDTKFKKNIVIGVTMPYEAHNNAQVTEVLNSFLKKMKIQAIIFSVISVLFCLINNFTLTLIAWSIVFLLCMALPQILYFKYNKILKKIKKDNNWIVNSSKK